MNIRNLVVSLVVVGGLFILLPNTVSAATLSFDPSTADLSSGEKVQIAVEIDAGTAKVLAADDRIEYPDDLLEVQGISDGSYFTIGKKDFSTSGKIYVAGIVENPAMAKTGEGTLVTITFKAISDGTATVTHVCTPGQTASDSNIAQDDIDATDIIDCASNGELEITIGEPDVVSPDETGDSTGGTETSELPASGVIDELMKFAVPGTILLLLGVGLKLLL